MSDQKSAGSGLSRRQFIFSASLGSFAVLSGARSALADRPESEVVPAVLIDVSRCVGCGNCQRSCAEANDLPQSNGPQPELSATTFTVVQRYATKAGQERFVKRACMHCLHPGCAAACPVGALHKTPEGPVVADANKCIGCRYCQYACPFGVPKFEWQDTLGVMKKCTSCVERLDEGQPPACVAGCASGALKFGARDKLLEEAHARLDARPDQYVDRVYGETEAGGTARLYLSDTSFEQLGLPPLGSQPVPQNAEAVMTRTPVIAASVAGLSTLAYAFLRRREKNVKRKSPDSEEPLR